MPGRQVGSKVLREKTVKAWLKIASHKNPKGRGG